MTDIENRLHALRRNADLHRERDQLLARLRTLEPRRFAPSRFCLDVSHCVATSFRRRLAAFEAGHDPRRARRWAIAGTTVEPGSRSRGVGTANDHRRSFATHTATVPVLVHNPSVELARRVIENTAPGNQVVFLTSQRAIAEAVNTFGGKVTYLNPPAIAPVAPLARSIDVNLYASRQHPHRCTMSIANSILRGVKCTVFMTTLCLAVANACTLAVKKKISAHRCMAVSIGI